MKCVFPMGTVCTKASKKNHDKFSCAGADNLINRFDTGNTEAGVFNTDFDASEETDSVNTSNGAINKEKFTKTCATIQVSDAFSSNQEPEKTIMAEPNICNEASTEHDNENKNKPEKVLQKHSELFPENKQIYAQIFEASSILRENLGTDNFLSKVVKSLIHLDDSLDNETDEIDQQVTAFATELGIPKLCCDIFRYLRNLHEDLTKWDREDTITLLKKSVDIQDINEEDNVKVKNKERAQGILNSLIGTLMNYTDKSTEFSAACGEAGLVDLLLQIISELQDCIPSHVPYVNLETQELERTSVRGKTLAAGLGLMYNLFRHTGDGFLEQKHQAVGLLVPLSKVAIPEFATDSLLCLAYIIDESNNHLIMSGTETIKFIIEALDRTLAEDDRRYLGYSSAELADGLSHIALNDENKKKIGQCGGIDTLVAMLTSAETDYERELATKALWTLAFDEDNKKIIKSKSLCLDELHKLEGSDDPEVQKAAAGVLWEVEGKQKHFQSSEESKNRTSDQSTSDAVPGSRKHVMISYQWEVQKIMIQVKNKLQSAGYKVWMDLEQMGGSTLEAMAGAIENSAVVLVCLSQKYKDSPNCRSEAEYAFSLRKDIVPLMLQRKYRPDGWLGMIVGTKLWFSLFEAQKFEHSIEGLKKELGERGKIMSKTQGGEPIVKVEQVEEVSSSGPNVKSWSKTDVNSWLQQIGLESKISNKAKERLDGKMLVRLQGLRYESADFFYKFLQTGLEIACPFDVLQFTDELANIAAN